MAKKTEQKQTTKEATAVTTKTKVAAAKMKRSELVRKQIKDCFEKIDESYITAAKLLNEAYHKEFFLEWGYEKFDEYCGAELEIHYRKAMYFVDIIDTVKKFDLDLKEVEAMGWSKMKEICTVINEKNAATWMKKAKDMSARELTEAVKMVRRKDTSQTDVPSITTMTLRMSEAEASIIMDALTEAKKICNSENTVVALGMICQDWMEAQGTTPNLATLESHVSLLEKVYGVKLTPVSQDEAKKAAAKKKEKKEVLKEAAKRDEAKKEAAEESGDLGIEDLLDDIGPEAEGSGEVLEDPDDINAALGLD
jgi:hypothetical protein